MFISSINSMTDHCTLRRLAAASFSLPQLLWVGGLSHDAILGINEGAYESVAGRKWDCSTISYIGFIYSVPTVISTTVSSVGAFNASDAEVIVPNSNTVQVRSSKSEQVSQPAD